MFSLEQHYKREATLQIYGSSRAGRVCDDVLLGYYRGVLMGQVERSQAGSFTAG